ncbi:hypothetical protein M422DRAFT_276908 [Sphaerobolus stellatus SS14]|uniref:Uncharacterized protein n=1 Tax=Sphaerobolus stellatus (strain SS14) TaxID=990650 RepID=A0A0C9UAT9_SPHS4|nr:hypothetical protein M422DRAFT_276908 [Sphaerobolus stellatus SS14]
MYLEYHHIFRLIGLNVPSRAVSYIEKKPPVGQLQMKCIMRINIGSHINRLPSFRPSQGDVFYLQLEGEYALMETTTSLNSPYQLRLLFIYLLVNDYLENPAEIWSKYRDYLAYDFFLENSRNDILAKELCLKHLAHLLEEYGVRLSRFSIEEPVKYTNEVLHEISHCLDCQGVSDETTSTEDIDGPPSEQTKQVHDNVEQQRPAPHEIDAYI